MVKGKFRGHQIEVDGKGRWVFSDTMQPASEDNNTRPCHHCGKRDTVQGYDGCLGKLKGVMNACCGHGVADETYVQFLDGWCLRGESAWIVINELREYNLYKQARGTKSR